jgi:hypothetical protein
MAINATTDVLYDGTVNATVKMIGICDGSGLDESNVVKVDVSSLIPVGGRIRIDRVQFDVAYGVIALAWDAVTPVPFLYLDGHGDMDFKSHGGMQNTAGSDATGNIVLSATGFDLNSTYSIILKMRKKG